MDSLSDVLKNMPFAGSLGQVEEKKRKLLEHPQIRKLIAEHPELTGETIRLNLPRLYQFATEYDNCAACPGLDLCPNDFTGHYTRLTVEEAGGLPQIVDRKVPCRKWKARRTEMELRHKIKSFYVDEQLLRRNYQPSEIASLDPERESAVLQIGSYIRRTREQGLQAKGLYLVGHFGTGKTFLMGYMLSELAKSGYTGVIVYMPDFVEELKGMFGQPEQLKETIDLMKETDLLVFDDIGAENVNPWFRDHVLGSILNYRMNRKPTFYTSNHDLDRLQEHYSFTAKEGEEAERGERLMERIRPFVDVVAVGGVNKRGMFGT
jgi:primosomal protein DnaI